MAPDTRENEAPKQTLAAGHPQAGYTAPALDGEQGTGTLPEAEQEWKDDRVQAQTEENDAVVEHEDEVAKQEAEESDKEKDDEKTPAAPKPGPKPSTPKDQS